MPAPDRPVPMRGLHERALAWLDRWRWAVFAGLALLYLAAFNGHWRPTPDSALYMTIARNIAQGEGFVDPSGAYQHINPGLPHLAAAMFRLFGDSMMPVLAALLLMAGLTLACVYEMFRLHAGRPVAVLMVLVLGTCETFYQFAFIVLNEIPFVLGAAMTLLGYERFTQRLRRPWLSAMLVIGGIVVMGAFRSVVATFLVALVLAAIVDLLRARRPLVLGAGLAVVVVVALLARAMNPHPFFELSGDERIMLDRLIALPQTLEAIATDRLPYLLTEAGAEAIFGVDYGPVPATVLTLAALAATLTLWRHRTLWFLLVWVFLAQWLVVLVVDRYFLPVLPVLLYAWREAAVWVGDRAGRWREVVIAAAMVVLVGSNLVMVGQFIVEQRQSPFLATFKDGRFLAPAAAAAYLREHAPSGAVVLAPEEHASVLGYWTDLAVLVPAATSATQTLDHVYLVTPLTDAESQQLAAAGLGPGELLFETPHAPDAMQVHRVRRLP